MEKMTPELLAQLRRAAPLAETTNGLSISGDTMKVAAVMMASGSLGLLLDMIDRQQAVIEQHAANMQRVLEAAVGELTRRAAPHTYESMAWNAGMEEIAQIRSAQPIPAGTEDGFSLALHLLDRIDVDADDQERVDQACELIKTQQAELKRRSSPLESTLQLRKLLEEAFDRISDLMDGQDGQACKEATRFIQRSKKVTLTIEPAIRLQPAAAGAEWVTLPVPLVRKALNGAGRATHEQPFCPTCGAHHQSVSAIAQMLPTDDEKQP